jgi:hypothetical protein
MNTATTAARGRVAMRGAALMWIKSTAAKQKIVHCYKRVIQSRFQHVDCLSCAIRSDASAGAMPIGGTREE